MACQSVESVFSNADLVLQIYQQLDLQSQLRLSRANSQMASVFHSFLFKENYSSLNIFEKGWDFIVTNETEANHLSANFEELQEFLKVFSHGVEKLRLSNIKLDLERYGYVATDLTYGQLLQQNHLNIQEFKNLRSLTYNFMSIPLYHIRLVAALFPKLEELCITDCSLGNDIYIILHQVLPGLRQLKSICIKDFLRFRLPFHKFQELVHQGHLETLHMSAALEPGTGLQLGDDYSPSQLKELHIEATFEEHRWPNNFSVFLGYFDNITTLQLEVVESITDKTLAILRFACKELRVLEIRYSTFNHVKHMVMPAKVRELSINWCRGLTYKNLEQILTHTIIAKFSSKNTNYDGEIHRIKVSPLMECLNIDSAITQGLEFPTAPNALKELTWYHPWSADGSFNTISLETCSQLQTLNIQEGYVDLKMLLVLGTLNTLMIPHPVPLLSWSYIIGLLTHSSLQNLCIKNFNGCGFRYEGMDLDVPIEGIKTGVINLEIPLDVFDLALTFWLNLFRLNKSLKQMSCTFYPNERYDEFLVQLVNHCQFSRAVKTINMCGFTLNCNEFRRNPAVFLRKLHEQTDYTKCWNDNDVFKIIIKKKC